MLNKQMTKPQMVEALLDIMACPEGLGTDPKVRIQYRPIVAQMIDKCKVAYGNKYIDELNDLYFRHLRK